MDVSKSANIIRNYLNSKFNHNLKIDIEEVNKSSAWRIRVIFICNNCNAKYLIYIAESNQKK